jgi:hypothetical protein
VRYSSYVRRVLPDLAAIAIFALIGAVQLWPAIAIPLTIPGRPAGDNVAFLWDLWWARESLAAWVNPLHTDFLMHPFGASLVLHTHALLPSYAAAFILGSLPLDRAYCLTLVAINVLNGLSLYALARFLTGARVIAICAGVLFQLSPYFTGHLSGHLNLMNGWLIPLGLLCFLKGIDTSHRGLALALGITIGAAAYTDYYVTVFLIASLIYWQVARVVAVTIRVGPYRAFDRGQQALVAMMAACSVGLGVIGLSGGFELEALGHTVSATSGINLRTAIWVLLIALAGRHFRPRIHAARRLRWGWTDLRFAAIALSVSLEAIS